MQLEKVVSILNFSADKEKNGTKTSYEINHATEYLTEDQLIKKIDALTKECIEKYEGSLVSIILFTENGEEVNNRITEKAKKINGYVSVRIEELDAKTYVRMYKSWQDEPFSWW